MKVGQRLLIGVDGWRLTDSQRRFLFEKEIGGVILFDHNATTSEQLKDFVSNLRSSVDVRPFIAIDFEGGRVQRLRSFLGQLGAPRDYAEDLGRLKADCQCVGRSMASLGINLNLAPVADLTAPPGNQALTDRTFSPDPSRTAEYCQIFIESFHGCGVLCCLKHFPGLGRAADDPHFQTAVVCLPQSQFETYDWVPFRAGVAAGAKFIMTTHMIASAIDAEVATFSPRVTASARCLGFDGIVISDDLCMGALRESGQLAELALRSLCSGHDMVIISRDYEKHASVVDYLEANIATLERFGHCEALARISDVKKCLS